MDLLDYALAHDFAESKTTKCNVNWFFTNPFLKPITKGLLY